MRVLGAIKAEDGLSPDIALANAETYRSQRLAAGMLC
jgi:hypothetical protein